MSELEQFLPFGLAPEQALVAMAGLVAFATVFAIWYGLLERDPMARRIKMVAEHRSELRGSMLRDRMPKRNRQTERMSAARRLVKSLSLLQSQQATKLQERLAPAGMRSRDAIVVFLLFKLAMPVVFGAAAFVLLYPMAIVELAPALKLVIVLGATGLGFFAPEMYVSNVTAKRQLAIGKGLPDGLDLLVICAESGLSLDAGLERVAGEIGAAADRRQIWIEFAHHFDASPRIAMRQLHDVREIELRSSRSKIKSAFRKSDRSRRMTPVARRLSSTISTKASRTSSRLGFVADIKRLPAWASEDCRQRLIQLVGKRSGQFSQERHTRQMSQVHARWCQFLLLLTVRREIDDRCQN